MNEWLEGLSGWMETLGLHRTMQTVGWAVPAVQVTHILAIAVVFASSMVLSLRVLQLTGTDWSPSRWGERLNGWIWSGLLVLLLSGFMMIAGEPARSLMNILFQTKMLLLIVAIGILLLLRRRIRALGSAQVAPPGVRLLAVLLMLIWVMIIVCGRWIAYS